MGEHDPACPVAERLLPSERFAVLVRDAFAERNRRIAAVAGQAGRIGHAEVADIKISTLLRLLDELHG